MGREGKRMMNRTMTLIFDISIRCKVRKQDRVRRILVLLHFDVLIWKAPSLGVGVSLIRPSLLFEK